MAIATINPATGKTEKTFTPLSDAQIQQKVRLAVETFKTYRKVPFAERARMMKKAGEL